MKRAVLSFLRFYKQRISPGLPAACRYLPTCSEYAYEAVERHGTGRGLWLTVRRLARCNPFVEGGVDPVPEPRRRRASGPVEHATGRRE